MGHSDNGHQPPRCAGTTKKGNPCKAAPLKGTDRCLAHSDEETRRSTNFQQGPRPGRPRNPRPVEVLREKIEANIEAWLKPLVDGLTAERGVVVGDGPTAHVEFFADHPTRIKAHREGFDRAFGRAAQTHELHHSTEESQVDRAIASLLEEMDRRDQAHANGNGKVKA